MKHNTDILNELMEISTLLAGIEKHNLFTVPAGYFEQLPGLLLMEVRDGEQGILNDISRKNEASVPAGYFDHLADTILSRIKKEQLQTPAGELRELSPMLYSIRDANPFTVPAGYFNSLSASIMDKLKSPASKLSVVRRTSSVFMKYAVAAAFTGIMALGVFKFTSPTIAKTDASAWTMNVDKELDNVSDDDMIRYLEANGENVDAITVASKTLDENELPTQADYLNDEKALDNYLDNVNTNELKN